MFLGLKLLDNEEAESSSSFWAARPEILRSYRPKAERLSGGTDCEERPERSAPLWQKEGRAWMRPAGPGPLVNGGRLK